MKRFLAVLTMLILSLAVLSACGDEKTPDVALTDFTNWQSYQIIRSDTKLEAIITEEAESYFSGQKSLETVVSIIQNRAETYIAESR